MRYEAALTADASATASSHLLKHYRGDKFQEDLCFALWRPSTGKERYTALIDEVILPREDERLLHGNASFQPNYLIPSAGDSPRKKVWELPSCIAIQVKGGKT